MTPEEQLRYLLRGAPKARALALVSDLGVAGAPMGGPRPVDEVLHDWPDEEAEAAAILRTIREHAPAGARVLIVDAVIPTGNEAHGSKWLDLLMLALFAARERDESQSRSMIEGAGRRVDAVEDGSIQATCP